MGGSESKRLLIKKIEWKEVDGRQNTSWHQPSAVGVYRNELRMQPTGYLSRPYSPSWTSVCYLETPRSEWRTNSIAPYTICIINDGEFSFQLRDGFSIQKGDILTVKQKCGIRRVYCNGSECGEWDVTWFFIGTYGFLALVSAGLFIWNR